MICVAAPAQAQQSGSILERGQQVLGEPVGNGSNRESGTGPSAPAGNGGFFRGQPALPNQGSLFGGSGLGGTGTRRLNLDISGAGEAYAADTARFSVFYDGYSMVLDAAGQAVVELTIEHARETNARRIDILTHPDGAPSNDTTVAGIIAQQIYKILTQADMPAADRIRLRKEARSVEQLAPLETGLMRDINRIELVVYP